MIALKKPILKVKNPSTGTYESMAAVTGTPGESSYDIAVRNGFVGTENEFLQQFVPENILTRVTNLEAAVANIDTTPPVASANTLGGVKVGNRLSIDANGVLSADEPTIPTASSSTLGGIKIGNGLTILNGVLSIDESKYMPIQNNSGYHNSIYRGKDLTGIYTAEQIKSKIYSAQFDDLFVGDYFTITINDPSAGNVQVKCIFADFDYFYAGNGGNIAEGRNHHAVMIADTCFGEYAMNATNTTVGGFMGSQLFTGGLSTYSTLFRDALRDYGIIPLLNIYGTDTVDTNIKSNLYAGFDGASSSNNYYPSITKNPPPKFISLLNSAMLFGYDLLSSSYYDVGNQSMQLAAFRYNRELFRPIKAGSNYTSWYWLSDVVNSTKFALFNTDLFGPDPKPASQKNAIFPWFVLSNGASSYYYN